MIVSHIKSPQGQKNKRVCVYLRLGAGCWVYSQWRWPAAAAVSRAESRSRIHWIQSVFGSDWLFGSEQTLSWTHCEVLWAQTVEPAETPPQGRSTELLHLLLQLLSKAFLFFVFLGVSKLHHNGRGATLRSIMKTWRHRYIQFSGSVFRNKMFVFSAVKIMLFSRVKPVKAPICVTSMVWLWCIDLMADWAICRAVNVTNAQPENKKINTSLFLGWSTNRF